jgi:hypothetical protein
MRFRFFSWALPLLVISACSSFDFIHSPSSEYRSFIEKRLKTDKIFDRGREVVSLHAMKGDQSLKTEQEKITPGFSIKLPPDNQEVIIAAIDISSWGRFSQENVIFKKNGIRASKIKEVLNPNIIASHYHFAYPQERVFEIYFPSESKEGDQLEMKTLYGEIKLSL